MLSVELSQTAGIMNICTWDICDLINSFLSLWWVSKRRPCHFKWGVQSQHNKNVWMCKYLLTALSFAFTNITVTFTCFLCLVPLGLDGCCYSSWPCSRDVAWSAPKGEEGRHSVREQLCVISTGNARLAERLLSLVCITLTLTPPSWFFGRGPPSRPPWSGLHSKYQEEMNTLILFAQWTENVIFTSVFFNILAHALMCQFYTHEYSFFPFRVCGQNLACFYYIFLSNLPPVMKYRQTNTMFDWHSLSSNPSLKTFKNAVSSLLQHPRQHLLLHFHWRKTHLSKHQSRLRS